MSKTTKPTNSIIRKGVGSMPSGGGDNRFLTLKDGDSITFAPLINLDELVSFDQVIVWVEGRNSPSWAFLGKDDPSIAMGVAPRYRALMPVLTKEGEVKIFGFGSSVARQFAAIGEEVPEIKGKVFRVRRTGAGLSTKYTIVAVGREVDVSKVEVPDVSDVEYTGPQDLESVLALLARSGVTVEAKPAESKSKAESFDDKKPAAKTVAKPAADTDDWDALG